MSGILKIAIVSLTVFGSTVLTGVGESTDEPLLLTGGATGCCRFF